MKTSKAIFLYSNSIILSTLFMLHILVFSSCSKSKDVSPEVNMEIPKDGVFKGEINGEKWNGKTTSAVLKDGKISISTTNENGDQLSIHLNGNYLGKYDFRDTLSNAIYTEKQSGVIYCTNLVAYNMGEVIISQIDTNYLLISGTLNLYLESNQGNIINFQNGEFTRIPYSYTSLDLFANMKGFINGVSFDAVAQANKDYLIGGKFAFVVGITSDSSTITLYIHPGDTVGNYNLPKNGNAAFIKNKIYYSYGAGNVEISSVDAANKLFSGKFNFYAVNQNNNLDSVFVSQGSFTNLKFP